MDKQILDAKLSDPAVSVASMTTSYDVDPWTLDLDSRFAALLEARRDIARIQAREARLIAAIADDPRDDSPAPVVEKDYVRDELRAALGESAVSVTNRIESARTLVHRLPATLDAVESGALTMRHAETLTSAVCALPDADTALVERRCIAFAAGRDLTAFARKVRREVLALDSRTMEQQLADFLAKTLQQRRVYTYADQYCAAIAHFAAVLPAEGAQALMTALDIAAEQHDPDDGRTKDQRRADALVQLGIDALNRFDACPRCRSTDLPRRDATDDAIVVPDDNPAAEQLPRWQGLRPSIQVSVALSTLLGQDNQPAELDGHGPIPAALARRLADDPTGTWRRLVTDPLGTLVDYGRTVYKPPAALRDFIIARDRTCRFPSCNRPACRCELDHIVAWDDNGQTNEPNLHALCCRHHHFKHENNWTVERRPDGATVWTNPAGDTFVVDAATYPIDRTAEIVVQNDNETAPPDEQAA